MFLHTQIFFLKMNNHVFKRSYLSSISQYDQGMADTSSFVKAVLKKLKMDGAQIQKLIAKLDNASCYYSNYLPQAMYQLCKDQGIMLVRCGYNEPCKGKYQYNCECDGLKIILKSLNVDSVNGIFIALNQRKSLKNTKISGTEFGKAK